MRRLTIVVLASASALLLFSVIDGLEKDFPLKATLHHVLPHLLLVATAVLVGSLLLLIVEETFEKHLVPSLRDGFQGLGSTVNDAMRRLVTSLEATLHTGFETTAGALAKEVSRFPQAWKNLSDERVRQELVSTVKDPHVKELVAEGRIKEAIAALSDHTKLIEEIAVLLLSLDETDWIKALQLVEANKVQEPKYYLTLAYRSWSIGKIEKATELAEHGIKLAEARNDAIYIAKFKNSLAYYYADAQNLDKEASARQYAEESHKARPDAPQPLDTLDFVYITYGKKREDIIRGVELCDKARRMGTNFAVYAKHVARANLRLQQLPSGASGQP